MFSERRCQKSFVKYHVFLSQSNVRSCLMLFVSEGKKGWSQGLTLRSVQSSSQGDLFLGNMSVIMQYIERFHDMLDKHAGEWASEWVRSRRRSLHANWVNFCFAKSHIGNNLNDNNSRANFSLLTRTQVTSPTYVIIDDYVDAQ